MKADNLAAIPPRQILGRDLARPPIAALLAPGAQPFPAAPRGKPASCVPPSGVGTVLQ